MGHSQQLCSISGGSVDQRGQIFPDQRATGQIGVEYGSKAWWFQDTSALSMDVVGFSERDMKHMDTIVKHGDYPTLMIISRNTSCQTCFFSGMTWDIHGGHVMVYNSPVIISYHSSHQSAGKYREKTTQRCGTKKCQTMATFATTRSNVP